MCTVACYMPFRIAVFRNGEKSCERLTELHVARMNRRNITFIFYKMIDSIDLVDTVLGKERKGRAVIKSN
jgi:hypothetical protein